MTLMTTSVIALIVTLSAIPTVHNFAVHIRAPKKPQCAKVNLNQTCEKSASVCCQARYNFRQPRYMGNKNFDVECGNPSIIVNNSKISKYFHAMYKRDANTLFECCKQRKYWMLRTTFVASLVWTAGFLTSFFPSVFLLKPEDTFHAASTEATNAERGSTSWSTEFLTRSVVLLMN